MYLNSAKAEVWSLEFFNTWWDTDEKQDSSCHIAGCCGLDEVRRAGAPRCLKTCLTRDLCDLYRSCWAAIFLHLNFHTKDSRLLGGFNRFFMILHSDSSCSQCQVVLLGSWPPSHSHSHASQTHNIQALRPLLCCTLGLCKGKPWHWRSHVVRLAPGSLKSGGVTHEILRAPSLPEELEEQSARGFEVACNLFRTQLVFGRFSGCDMKQQWKHQKNLGAIRMHQQWLWWMGSLSSNEILLGRKRHKASSITWTTLISTTRSRLNDGHVIKDGLTKKHVCETCWSCALGASGIAAPGHFHEDAKKVMCDRYDLSNISAICPFLVCFLSVFKPLLARNSECPSRVHGWAVQTWESWSL